MTSQTNEDEADSPPPALNLTAEPSAEVVAFLEACTITGVRAAGRSSRLLMNNQVYKIGSIVEPTTRLRITNILDDEIHFIDESGALYRKQFRR
jgi:hypothetical protein